MKSLDLFQEDAQSRNKSSVSSSSSSSPLPSSSVGVPLTGHSHLCNLKPFWTVMVLCSLPHRAGSRFVVEGRVRQYNATSVLGVWHCDIVTVTLPDCWETVDIRWVGMQVILDVTKQMQPSYCRSEWVSKLGFTPYQHIAGHFGDESFQSVTCTGTDNLTRTTKRQNTNNKITQCKKGP